MPSFPFLKKINWSFISVVLAILFGIIMLYTLVHEDKPNISIEILNEADVLNVQKPLADLSILFRGDDIKEKNYNLKIFTVKLENTGDVDILQNFFDKDRIWGLKVDNGKIIEVRLINSNSEYIFNSLKPVIEDEQYVVLNKVIFDKNKYFSLELLVLHTKDKLPKILPIGKISGIEKINLKETWKTVGEKSFFKKLLEGSFFLHIVRLLFYSLILFIFAIIIGVSFNFIDLYRKKANRIKRENHIKLLLDTIPTIDDITNKIYNYYIKYDTKGILYLIKLLKDKNSLKENIKKYKALESLRLFPTYAILKLSGFSSRIEPVIKSGAFKIDRRNRLYITQSYKKALKNILEHLSVHGNKKTIKKIISIKNEYKSVF